MKKKTNVDKDTGNEGEREREECSLSIGAKMIWYLFFFRSGFCVLISHDDVWGLRIKFVCLHKFNWKRWRERELTELVKKVN